MGIYDREYDRRPYRDSYGGGGGFQLGMPESTVNRIVLVTIAAYIIEVMFSREGQPNAMIDALGLQSNWMYQQPWAFYKLFTYALIHSEYNIMHVLFNMLGVWLFGREIEQRIGGKEFLLFYLAAVLSGGLLISLYDAIVLPHSISLGASAGTVAVVILFAFYFPHRQGYFAMLIPMPMWVLGLLIVGMDLSRAFGANPGNVSWQGHIGGAAFAAFYFLQKLRLSDWVPDNLSLAGLKPKSKPKLRVHAEYDDEPVDTPDPEQDRLAAEVDRVLAKIGAQGADSLTAKEKKLLEDASRQYKDRRRR